MNGTLHDLFSNIRAITQEQKQLAHPTSLEKMKKDFAMLPDELRQEFLTWVNSHDHDHLIDLIEEEQTHAYNNPNCPSVVYPHHGADLYVLASDYHLRGDPSVILYSPPGIAA